MKTLPSLNPSMTWGRFEYPNDPPGPWFPIHKETVLDFLVKGFPQSGDRILQQLTPEIYTPEVQASRKPAAFIIP